MISFLYIYIGCDTHAKNQTRSSREHAIMVHDNDVRASLEANRTGMYIQNGLFQDFDTDAARPKSTISNGTDFSSIS
jgi:hypothetical protein